MELFKDSGKENKIMKINNITNNNIAYVRIILSPVRLKYDTTQALGGGRSPLDNIIFEQNLFLILFLCIFAEN